jgi:HD-GYP domain-containing protein (c-di-GMP phosphodiesterase class II)
MLIERHLSALTLQSRLVIYQMHERCDGSGYPRGVAGESIHPLAKISSVADAYLALVSPRPHRTALLPYHAIRHLLSEVRSGLYDPQCMRALLQASSLFPLGSHVRLSDGRQARVIRANGASFDRPVVCLPQADGTSDDMELIDLLQTSELHIEAASPQAFVST